ncbi:hypothetical protein EV401DRAFT_1963460 [Pisolithus croceorrhizus]|nr:hypothetical protein EV401DRAFT_1963460 [Pisolithus croceorrhizus]
MLGDIPRSPHHICTWMCIVCIVLLGLEILIRTIIVQLSVLDLQECHRCELNNTYYKLCARAVKAHPKKILTAFSGFTLFRNTTLAMLSTMTSKPQCGLAWRHLTPYEARTCTGVVFSSLVTRNLPRHARLLYPKGSGHKTLSTPEVWHFHLHHHDH